MYKTFPNFFQFNEIDFNSCCFAQIVPDKSNYDVMTKNQVIITMWEAGHKATIQTDMFQHDDEIAFKLAHVAFKDSPWE